MNWQYVNDDLSFSHDKKRDEEVWADEQLLETNNTKGNWEFYFYKLTLISHHLKRKEKNSVQWKQSMQNPMINRSSATAETKPI